LTSPVLLLVDVQRNMLQPPTPVPGAPAVAAAIDDVLAAARTAGAAVVHIRNNGPAGEPDEPGTPGWELTHEPRPGEHIVDKWTPDAFQDTKLSELVPEDAHLVVVGMQSEFCVRETSLAALGRGHQVTLVRGAHATYDDGVAESVEAELTAAGVTVADPVGVTF
jgi:nicotinamidase-related amidase